VVRAATLGRLGGQTGRGCGDGARRRTGSGPLLGGFL